MASDADQLIAFQGYPGAYSHLACRDAYPDLEALPCKSFEDAFDAVESGRAHLAMIPIENSVAGRVADHQYFVGRVFFLGGKGEVFGFGAHLLTGNDLYELADVIFIPFPLEGVHRRLRDYHAIGLRVGLSENIDASTRIVDISDRQAVILEYTYIFVGSFCTLSQKSTKQLASVQSSSFAVVL